MRSALILVRPIEPSRRHAISKLHACGDVRLLQVGFRSDPDVCTGVQAMGDFPYPSGYMLNGHGELPAYPMHTACQPLSQEGMTGPALLEGLQQAVGTFYNFSGQLPCYNYSEGPNPETDDDSNFWEYQACTEMVMPFSRNGGDA